MQQILPTEVSVKPTSAAPSKGQSSSGQKHDKAAFENELDRHSKQDVREKPGAKDATDGKAAKVAAGSSETKNKTESKESSGKDKSAKDKSSDSLDEQTEAEDWFSLIENARNLGDGDVEELQELLLSSDESLAELVEGLSLATDAEGDSEASEKLQALLADLIAGLDLGDDELISVDIEQLRSMLAAVLDDFEWQGQPLSEDNKEQLLALLDVQLEAVEAIENTDKESEHESQQLVANLLAQLNQMLSKEGDTPRANRGGVNQPSPIVQAMAQASEELRQQMQKALSEGNDESEDAESVNNLRRLFADSLAQQNSGSENRPQQGNVQSANNAQNLVNNSTNSMTTQQRQAQEAQQSSAQESARQTQQAIDILGPQAPQQLRERISVMFNSRTQAAEIRLDPPDLGRMQIRINLSQEQTAVSFQVTNPQAREALEQSIPRLRELLEEQGLNLTEANVSEESEQQTGDDGDTATGFANNMQSGEESELDEQAYVETNVQPMNGRIDYYA